MRPTCSSRGFTLIELLVVITIIGVHLRFVCSPPSRPPAKGARRVQCTNNPRQIASGDGKSPARQLEPSNHRLSELKRGAVNDVAGERLTGLPLAITPGELK